MKKKIMTVAIAAIALFSTTAFAQNPSNCQNGTECAKQPSQQEIQMLMFDGIQLTDAQKAQLKVIPSPGKKQAERQQKERQDRAKQKKADRLEYLNSVKAVLTPDQYVQFLENSFVNTPAKKGHKAHKGDAKSCHKNRGDKQCHANCSAPRK